MGAVPGRAVTHGVTAAAGGWVLEWRWAGAAALHAPWPPPRRLGRRAVAVCAVVGAPALVLGSTQAETVADAAALASASVELVRRSSGGGAVLVEPGGQVWIDVWVPRGDVLWDDDVVRASAWLGDTWAAALSSLGVAEVSVHRGRVLGAAWSDTLCFAGLGPGEVSAGGRKVVGLSQRRTRDGARLHTMALLEWDAGPLVGLLDLDAGARARASRDTAGAAVGLRQLLGVEDAQVLRRLVEEAVLEALPHGEGAEQHR